MPLLLPDEKLYALAAVMYGTDRCVFPALEHRFDLLGEMCIRDRSETLEGVVAARARATQTTIDADNLTPEAIEKYQAAQGELTAALGRLLMIQENYPDLKANQNFSELQAQLEGTENRIATERRNFNEAARAYNTRVRCV